MIPGPNTITMGDHLGKTAPKVLPGWPENFVDAVVTDPPYELTANKKGGSGPASVNLKSPHGRARVGTGFMGMKWDGSGVAFSVDFWRAVLRVMKPGAHLLAFGGTRTYHRMACAIEDAGFEIRDQAQWIYGQGFPKSLDVSKAIDRANGDTGKRPVVRQRKTGIGTGKGATNIIGDGDRNITSAASAASAAWEGWGTALKPANEPICLARKPISEGTVAANVLRWGTGALNIEAGRIGEDVVTTIGSAKKGTNAYGDYNGMDPKDHIGRWPANVLTDQYTAGFLDAQEAGCSKVFYVAKPDGGERNCGLEDGEERQRDAGRKAGNPGGDNPRNRGVKPVANFHPTVKPVALMEYLIRLVTPPGGGHPGPVHGLGDHRHRGRAPGASLLGH